jgi:hypothetical protein
MVYKQELESGRKLMEENRILLSPSLPVSRVSGVKAISSTTGGFASRNVSGRPCEPWETVQQRRSSLECTEQFDEEGWAAGESEFPLGQQMWRDGEGSGLTAGEAPACTTTAARECIMPEHANAGWLTDQPSSVTIKTTPSDRLAITGKIMERKLAAGCDCGHIG